MRSPSLPVIAILLLAGPIGFLPAQDARAQDLHTQDLRAQDRHTQDLPPIQLSKLPHVAIISPVFFWDSQVDVVRTVSATCPSGRPIAGGISFEKGNASVRIRESYPEGASWVIRVVRRGVANAQPVEARAFAVCLLPVARGGSVQIAQYPRLLHLSHRFALPPGDVTTADRQACAQNTLIISGGLGLDPEFKDRSLLRMELSYPDKWGWNVRASNGVAAGQSAAEVRVFGICLGNDEGLSIQDYQNVEFAGATVTVKAGDGAVRQSVACRSAQARAIAGGARLIRGKNTGLEIQESFPDTPASWTVAVANRAPANAGDATVRLYAVCIAP